MERVQQGLATTVYFTFEAGGTAVNPVPDSATLRILRADGTELLASTPATEAGTGRFSYTLSPTQTALLDHLRLEWTATLGGTAQTIATTVEVVGGFYFTISEAKALEELSTKSAEDIAHGRTLAEEAFEQACGYAFVPRYARTTFSAGFNSILPLSRKPLRTIRAVSEVSSLGGDPSDVSLSDLALTTSGLYRSGGWLAGPNNVTVGYEYGADEPPERVKRAVLLLAKTWLTTGPIDDRATGIPTENGTITLLTPGIRGTVFGIPEVDAVVEQYGIKKAGIHSLSLAPDSNAYYRSAW